VTFDPNVCTHGGTCLRGLPAVFDLSRKRWIRSELASPDEVAAQVGRCPSGALHYQRPEEAATVPHVKALVPMAHVTSVPRSIGFYEGLGFTVRNTHEPSEGHEPVWASLESSGAQLMLALADEPVVPSQQAVLFYVYCDDVVVSRTAFEKNGIAVGPIEYPFWAPRGEFRVTDPDGFVVMVTHT